MNLFGSKKKADKPKATPRAAIERLDLALSDLDKRERLIEKKIETEVANAKKMIAAKNKNGAKHALKRKKMYEDNLGKLHGTRMTIEQQKMALENANFNMDIMQAMSQGAGALGAINQNIGIDEVDRTMGEIQDQMDIANEISEAISQPTTFGFEDEDEIEAELAELEAEGLDESLLNVEAPAAVRAPPVADAPLPDLPSAPQAQEEEEDEELRRLEASMA